MKIDNIDIVHGIDDNGYEYGYAGIDGKGGKFFTWKSSLYETIESIEDDVTDPPEGWTKEAHRNVRGIIRRNHKEVMNRPSHMFGKKFHGY